MCGCVCVSADSARIDVSYNDREVENKCVGSNANEATAAPHARAQAGDEEEGVGGTRMTEDPRPTKLRGANKRRTCDI